MVSAAIRATPWLVPGVVVALAVALATRHRMARWLGSPRWLALALTTSLGMVLVITVTPSTDGGFWGRSRVGAFAVTSDVIVQLTSINDVWLNVALVVPLAMVVQLVARRAVRRGLGAGLFALPVVIELVQYALPVLGRSGFQMNDVVANTLGVLLGTAVGWFARLALQRTPQGRAILTPAT